MQLNIAINGFGRIGKVALKLIEEHRLNGKNIRVVAINSPSTNIDHIIYMLKYDSVHPLFKNISILKEDNKEYIILNKNKILLCRSYEISKVNWGELNIDFVIESSGAYRTIEKAQQHIESGAKNVIISAPSDSPTFIYGINHQNYKKEMKIISNASCTTNCLTPLLKVLNDNFEIEEALMSFVDGSSKKEWRLGRSTLNNIIPTSTGAAKAVEQVLPELKGKITGLAYRIPIINGSLIDLTVRLKKDTSYQEIMEVINNNSLNETITVTEDPIVSSDIIGTKHSCIVDKGAGIELNKNFFKIIAWYDNEVGYTSRLIDLILYISELK
jgi:glyceraldehyde 3-phosphate dehydrogenase